MRLWVVMAALLFMLLFYTAAAVLLVKVITKKALRRDVTPVQLMGLLIGLAVAALTVQRLYYAQPLGSAHLLPLIVSALLVWKGDSLGRKWR
ncbi:hypothetical protein WMW72_29200 [Paenibacillus filicis]|uniref:Uncharacterized protein n=1 Tax=Paenibacillus filicis TaxID=669464 RepID=A0ABU9DSZ1_9BACL